MAQRKLTLKQAQEFLNKLGADVELVADDATDIEYNEDELYGVIDSAREPIISQKLRGTLEADLNKSISGKISAATRKSLIDATGVPSADIEGKDTKEATKIAVAFYAKSLGTDKETAASQLQEVMANHAKEVQRLTGERETEKQQYQRQIASFGINQVLGGLYSTAKGIDPKANKAILQEDFKNYLERTYELRLSEDQKSILLYDKNNPEKLALNEAGTQVVQLSDIQKKYHVERGQWNEDNRQVNPADKQINVKPFPVKTTDGKVLTTGNQVDAQMREMLGV